VADIDLASDPAGHRSRVGARLLEGGGEAFLDYGLLGFILGLEFRGARLERDDIRLTHIRSLRDSLHTLAV
jgi:hypothetical protein